MRNAHIKVSIHGITGTVAVGMREAFAIDQHGTNNRAVANCLKAADVEGEALIRTYSAEDAKAARAASHGLAQQVAALAKLEWSEETAWKRAALSRQMMKGLATSK